MAAVKTDVQDLHFEHRIWDNELSFFTDEIKIFEHRLEALASKVEDAQFRAQLEQYQNQFIRQKEVVDELKHDIKVHEQELGKLLRQEKEIQDKDITHHQTVRERMTTFRKLYADLKANFNQFVLRWM